jgi:hypothetical protein
LGCHSAGSEGPGKTPTRHTTNYLKMGLLVEKPAFLQGPDQKKCTRETENDAYAKIEEMHGLFPDLFPESEDKSRLGPHRKSEDLSAQSPVQYDVHYSDGDQNRPEGSSRSRRNYKDPRKHPSRNH